MKPDTTRIGFGQGLTLTVGLPLETVRNLLQQGLQDSAFVAFTDVESGETVIINPAQVKVMQ